MEVTEREDDLSSVKTSTGLGKAFFVQLNLAIKVIVEIAADGKFHDEAQTIICLERVLQLLQEEKSSREKEEKKEMKEREKEKKDVRCCTIEN